MFRLAAMLGVPHPDHLYRILTSRQISEWMAYANIEPFGEQHADYRSGIIAATVANANRDPHKKPAPFQPSDFVAEYETTPSPRKRQQKQSADEQLSIVESLNKMFGGRDIRGSD